MESEPAAEDLSATEAAEADEMARRATRVRELMGEAGLDALIGFGTNDKLTGGNSRYLAGSTAGPLPAPSYIIVGSSGPVTIVVMENRAATVGNHARSFCAPGIDVVVGQNGDWAAAVGAALGAVGANGTVGTDGLPAANGALLDKLRALLPGATFRPHNKLIDKARRDKSPFELELCRKASQISHQVYEHFQQIVEPGMPHESAVAEASHLAARAGGEELVLALGSGRPWVWSSATAARLPGVFESGQPVSCEVNVRYRGYFSQVARSWPVGAVSRDRQRMIDAVRAGHECMIETVRPGVRPRDVFRAGLAEVRRHGFDYHGIRYGHGLGLTIGEGWDFADDDENPVGTTLSPLSGTAYAVCHPFLFERSADGTVVFNALYGDPWVMGADRAQRAC